MPPPPPFWNRSKPFWPLIIYSLLLHAADTSTKVDKEAVMGSFDAAGKPVEVVFCFDTTGSMYSCLTQVCLVLTHLYMSDEIYIYRQSSSYGIQGGWAPWWKYGRKMTKFIEIYRPLMHLEQTETSKGTDVILKMQASGMLEFRIYNIRRRAFELRTKGITQTMQLLGPNAPSSVIRTEMNFFQLLSSSSRPLPLPLSPSLLSLSLPPLTYLSPYYIIVFKRCVLNCARRVVACYRTSQTLRSASLRMATTVTKQYT